MILNYQFDEHFCKLLTTKLKYAWLAKRIFQEEVAPRNEHNQSIAQELRPGFPTLLEYLHRQIPGTDATFQGGDKVSAESVDALLTEAEAFLNLLKT
jgi:hypothetical protein